MIFLNHYQKRNCNSGSRLAELKNLPVITYDEAFQTGLIQVIPHRK